LYITPVGFSSALINEKWRYLYALNPMVGIIDGFRWCILGEKMNWIAFFISASVVLVVFSFGIQYFRKTEKSFADHI
jgi:lipopolysaccharide transport system permease protein